MNEKEILILFRYFFLYRHLNLYKFTKVYLLNWDYKMSHIFLGKWVNIDTEISNKY